MTEEEREALKEEIKQELVQDFAPAIVRSIDRSLANHLRHHHQATPPPHAVGARATTESHLRAVVPYQPLPDLEEESPEDVAWKLDNPEASHQ